jgi:hypothetical protein
MNFNRKDKWREKREERNVQMLNKINELERQVKEHEEKLFVVMMDHGRQLNHQERIKDLEASKEQMENHIGKLWETLDNNQGGQGCRYLLPSSSDSTRTE